jgi:uncharacterized protein (TIGR00299 family) protein
MRTLAFDGRVGASGDMLLGALIAAGADPAVLSPVEDALPIRYTVRDVTTAGLAATAVDVRYEGDTEADGHDQHEGDDAEGDSHDHHGDDSGGHDHTPAEGHGPNRSYAEVRDIVAGMDLPEGVESRATAIFRRLGEAEAAVHGTDIESIHFHEVGADDAIADVVGVCLLLADLDVEQVVTTPVSAGGGTVEMSHGTYPVPTPAVVEIAGDADWSLVGGPHDRELLTPTGAAILAEIAEGVDSLPEMTLDASGYGAGGYDLGDTPNVLRALLGTAEGGLRREPITVLETNLDDATPEVLGGLQETLKEAGARDVSILPATMKKSRPGHLLKVIVRPADADRVARKLAAETGTLGVREHGAGHRWVADRERETVTLSVDGQDHEVTVKVATDTDGSVIDVSTEYDDAAAVAAATDRPVRDVIALAEARWREA